MSRRRVTGLLTAGGLGALLATTPETEARKKKHKLKGKGKGKKKHKKSCKPGAVKCGKACVNLGANAQHCGGCGQRCTDGNAWVGGQCQVSGCPGAQLLCGGVCANPEDDEAHCGACDNACQGDLTCIGGSCACAEGTACGNQCVDLDTSQYHCGTCDTPCAAGLQCLGGTCHPPACPHICQTRPGTCSQDPDSDERACGYECEDCTLNPGARCCDGYCSRGCAPGYSGSCLFELCGSNCQPCPEGSYCCNLGPGTTGECVVPPNFATWCPQPGE